MAIEPTTFLRRAVELGLLTPARAAEAGAALRARKRAGKRVRIEDLVVEHGWLDASAVDRIVGSFGGRSEPRDGTLEVPPSVLEGGRPGGAARVSLPATGRHRSDAPKYRPIELLGRGGMGEVLLAVDRDIGREVALKRVLEADDDHLRRFVREAQVTGQLEHPNIVPVYELGEEPGGERPYLVMKRLQGRSLAAELDALRGRRDGLDAAGASRELHRLLEAFLKICDGVSYAHSKGVIHRDLKPANVMVGDYGEVHVVDWGLARLVGGEDEAARSLAAVDPEADAIRTREGQISGTPMYMPPEQARGEISRLDARSDVYALGAMLYEMLTLAPPFEARDLMGLIQDVVKGRWVPIAERSIAPWDVPRELAAVVAKAMSREQGQRYATASELRREVEDFLAGRALQAAEYSPWELLFKWARRHRTAVIGGAATAAAVVLGIAATAIGVASARRAEAERVRAGRIAAAEALFDESTRIRSLAAAPFHPARSQAWFIERLPAAVVMGQAIEAHPDRPEAWRRELADYAEELQGRAEEVADWALAEHLAGSVVAWGAVDEAEGRARRERARAARQARIEADLARLDDLLRRIAEAEARSAGHGGLLPGEVQELARRAAALPSRAEVAERLASSVAADNGALRRKWNIILGKGFDEPTLGRSARLFAAYALAALGQTDASAPGLVAETLRSAWQLRAPAEETAAWILAAARLEAIRPGCIPAPGYERLLGDLAAEHAKAGPVALAIDRAEAFLAVTRGGGALPRLSGEARLVLDDLAEWGAATAAASSEYTARLLDEVEGGAPGAAVALAIDQLGLRADGVAPDPARPGRSAVTVLRRLLTEVAPASLSDEAIARPAGRAAAERAVAASRNLVRLGDGAVVSLLVEHREAAGEGSTFRRRTELALRLAAGDFPVAATPESERPFVWEAAGDLAAARAGFDDACRRAGSLVRNWRGRARVRLASGDVRGALEDLDHALESSGATALDHALRGRVRARVGDVSGALDDLSRAVELEPRNPVFRIERARLRLPSGDAPAALEDLEAAVEIDPWSSSAHELRSEVRESLGDFRGALADADKAVELEPWSFDAYRRRGGLRRRLGEFTQAIEDATRALELQPLSAAVFHERALARAGLGDFRGVVEDATRSIDLEPTPDRLLDRAAASQRLGLLRNAFQDARDAIERQPGHARAWFRYAEIVREWDRRAEALEAYGRAIQLDPLLAAAHLRRATLRSVGDPLGAIADATRAIELQPTADAHRVRAAIFREHGRLLGAVTDALRATELDPLDEEAWLELGICQALAGDADAARGAFEEAIRLAPRERKSEFERIRDRRLGG